MHFKRIAGQMVRVDFQNRFLEKNKKHTNNVIYWNFPSEPTVRNKRDIMGIPMMPSSNKKSKDLVASSSVFAGVGSLTLMNANAATNISSNGIFLPLFIEHIFPIMVDIAAVYALVKIAMDFYQEQRGGASAVAGAGGGGSTLNSFIKNGKWFVLFYMIPYFIKLLEEVGQRLASSVG